MAVHRFSREDVSDAIEDYAKAIYSLQGKTGCAVRVTPR